MTGSDTAAIEVTTVGPDVAVLHRGTEVRRYDGLTPDTVHDLDGVEVRTLPHPGGELLSRFATVNDVHFGEVRCGLVEGHEETIGPILESAPGEPPYPLTMNRAAVAEIQALGVDAVFAKGDLTTNGSDEEYQSFLDTYAEAFGDRLVHVRGNHDAYQHQSYAAWPTQRRDLPGATVVLLDTSVPGRSSGGLTDEQLAELDDVAAAADRPVVVLGHHHAWDPASMERPETYFGIHPDASERLVQVASRRESIVGYLAGHTHRNRVRRFAPTGAMPWAEVSCVKDFPGAWAEYRVYEGGVVQLLHRISSPEALDWTERTRQMFWGAYGDYAFGRLEDRCFLLGVVNQLPLADLRVVDASTVLAGPSCARYLADFGADVVKVERPGTGDGTRDMFRRDPADGVTYFWKLVGRGKRSIVLDLKSEQGREDMLDLCTSADVLVENFRPGTLERLGLGPDVLHGRNPDLVITRVTGFGQDGPYAGRAGFATLAEAMSGFAGLTGEPDGGPLLPPIALTDEVTGIAAAFATMVAVHSGVGQVVDVNLLESMLQIMGPLVSAAAVEGYEQPRLGSGIPYTVPRGTWRCADGGWVAVSTSAESVARRVLDLIGLGDDESLHSFEGRVAARDRVDARLAGWIGRHSRDEVLAAFEQAQAACAPVYSMTEVLADPHVAAREAVQIVDGTPMQGLVARLSATPGRIRWAGRPLGADTDDVLGELPGRRSQGEE